MGRLSWLPDLPAFETAPPAPGRGAGGGPCRDGTSKQRRARVLGPPQDASQVFVNDIHVPDHHTAAVPVFLLGG